MQRLIGYLGFALIAMVIIASVLAYLVVGIHPASGIMTDGLGRAVSPAPFYIRLSGADFWPGLTWWLADLVLFWGALFIAYKAIIFGFAKPDRHSNTARNSHL